MYPDTINKLDWERGFPTFYRPLQEKRRKQPFLRFRSKRVAQSVAHFVAQCERRFALLHNLCGCDQILTVGSSASRPTFRRSCLF